VITLKLLTTREVAAARGVTRQHIARLVRDGKLEPFATLANGAHLFTEDQAEPEAAEQ
jgi:predicted site-specific integrase-resolvase